jgi:formamidopyrimidine-DNA glycosylase
MPELPEVELVVRALRSIIVGRRINSARLLRPGLAPANTPEEFSRKLRNARIDSIDRRGKHILINVDRGVTLIVHLRMTGQFLFQGVRAPLPKHTHALFSLGEYERLVFTDQRHFGLMKVVPTAGVFEANELRTLAPEPFSAEFNQDYLSNMLSRTRREIKNVLLDQTKVVGLGNIYASETLFLARISPFAVAASLSRRRILRLHSAILKVLGEALAHVSAVESHLNGISEAYYDGANGGRWLVYDREREPCPVCGSRIRRIVQSGRSTYYCPRCQKR